MIKYFQAHITLQKILFFVFIAISLFLQSPAIALLLGFAFTLIIGNPFGKHTGKITNILLKASVVGLGFGINLSAAITASKDGVIFTMISIAFTITLGFIIGGMLKINRKTSHLLASGTAICGGSAIAAVGPVLNANEKEMSVSLGTIFLLNSIALFIFPPIAHFFSLTQHQFGVWAAIAIHDTSSVVGAASIYGQEALQTATTIKLVRTLWIVPVALLTAFLFKSKSKKVTIPYFIGFFIIAMLLSSYFPFIASISGSIVLISRLGLVLTLFLIGAGLSLDKIKSVGIKPLILGIILWVVISVVSFFVVRYL